MPLARPKNNKSVVFIENGTYLVPHLHNTWFDKLISGVSGNLMIANWIYSFSSLQCLPDIIPAIATKSGVKITVSKYLLLSIPLLGTLSLIQYARLASDPEKMSYPVKVNETNVRKVYSRGKVSSIIKGLFTQFIFFGISYLIGKTSHDVGSNLCQCITSRPMIGAILTAVVSCASLRFLFYL